MSIKDKRIEAEMSQEELAEKSGISRPTISAIETGKDKSVLTGTLIALAKAFFAGGGQQYTVTVVSPEDLIDAKEHPENHRNLIVRVGGYSDYFTNLTPELQDNVIKRTFMDV